LVSGSDFITLLPKQASLSFDVTSTSPFARFRFRAPDIAGQCETWVEVYQKNRSVQVIRASFDAKKIEG
jgi:hypothetical protein